MKNTKVLFSLTILCSIFLYGIFLLPHVNATPSYVISGKITDSNLKPIEGTKVVFEIDGGVNGIQSTITDYKGDYKVNVPVNNKTYWVTIGKEGYRTYRGKIQLTNENIFVFNFVLNK